VDHSSPDFPAERGRNLSDVFPILDIPIRSGDIRDRILKLSEMVAHLARFWPPDFCGEAPKFWDVYYKTGLTSYHVAVSRWRRSPLPRITGGPRHANCLGALF